MCLAGSLSRDTERLRDLCMHMKMATSKSECLTIFKFTERITFALEDLSLEREKKIQYYCEFKILHLFYP